MRPGPRRVEGARSLGRPLDVGGTSVLGRQVILQRSPSTKEWASSWLMGDSLYAHHPGGITWPVIRRFARVYGKVPTNVSPLRSTEGSASSGRA